MAKLSIVKGATSVLVRVFIQDSSSTTGAGLTGLAFNTSSLVCYRARDDDGNAGGTAISLVTATKGTWTSGGFVEKDSTNLPGWYEFGIPNNALATGSRSVSIMFKGATNMAPCPLEIELTGTDNQDGVHGGLTCLPNTAVTTNGSLITSGTGTAQLSVSSGLVATTSNVKTNQALATFTFLMTDSTNHAPATGLTITCTRSIDGGAFASGTLANAAELANGIYKVDFGAGDLNGKVVILKVTATGADTAYERIITQP